MIIIADDLTGAADCGVKFSEKGISTEIVFHNDETTDSNVAIYSTDSRSMSVMEAQNAVNALAENCSSRIFKLRSKREIQPSPPGVWDWLSS